MPDLPVGALFAAAMRLAAKEAEESGQVWSAADLLDRTHEILEARLPPGRDTPDGEVR